MSVNLNAFGGGPPSSNVIVNDSKMILIRSIIEDSIDKLTIINHLRNDESSSIPSIETYKDINIAETLSPSQQKKQKKLEINAINKIIHKLRENSNVIENKLNIQSLVNEPNSSNNKKSNEVQFLSVIRNLKNELQKVLEDALKEFEIKAECKSLNNIITDEEITLQRRNEMYLMVNQLKNKIGSLQITIKIEEEQFNSDVIKFKKQIINLKEEIRSIKQQIDTDQKLKKYELIAQLNTNHRQNKILQQSLNIALNHIKNELNREIKTFKATQTFLKKKLQVLDQESIKWQKKYDDETSKHKDKLQEIRDKRESTLCTLRESEIQFDEENSIKQARVETERKKKEMEEKVYNSAILIQKTTRGFLTRRRLQREREPKSKKKKGKKGGKGKKGKKGKKK